MKTYRSDLPVVPPRMRNLPVSAEGAPVPFFAAWSNGAPDIAVVDAPKLVACHQNGWCSICGEPLGQYKAFVLGPLGSVNRKSYDAPAHIDCAKFAAVTRKMGIGVALVWVTRCYSAVPGRGYVMSKVGEPEQTFWYIDGRSANRQEVMESLQDALPALYEVAHAEGEVAVMELDTAVARASRYFPKHAAMANHG
jgi:hypothetical protein